MCPKSSIGKNNSFVASYLARPVVLKEALRKALQLTKGELLEFLMDSQAACIKLPIVGELALSTPEEAWVFCNAAHELQKLRSLAPQYRIDLYEYSPSIDIESAVFTLETEIGLFVRKKDRDMRLFILSSEFDNLALAVTWAQDNGLVVKSQAWEGINANYIFSKQGGAWFTCKFFDSEF